MANKRNTRSSALKAKVVLDAIRERKTINEIAKQYSLHPTQIHQWKRLALDRFEELFVDGRSRKKTDESEISVEQLFEQIGRLQMELEWVKKNLPSSLRPSES